MTCRVKGCDEGTVTSVSLCIHHLEVWETEKREWPLPVPASEQYRRFIRFIRGGAAA